MRSTKWVALLGLAFILSGCGVTDILMRDRVTVIVPPAELYVCPPVPALPMPTLPGGHITDEQNAQLLNGLSASAIGCHQSLDAIKKNVEDQKAAIANHPVKDTTTTP